MSIHRTTVGKLTADDLGKRVEGDDWVIARLHYITHYDYNNGFDLGTDLRDSGSGPVHRCTHDTPCTVTDPLPTEPLDPAYRHFDESGIEWARIEDVWVSPDHHPLSWEDLLEKRGTW